MESCHKLAVGFQKAMPLSQVQQRERSILLGPDYRYDTKVLDMYVVKLVETLLYQRSGNSRPHGLAAPFISPPLSKVHKSLICWAISCPNISSTMYFVLPLKPVAEKIISALKFEPSSNSRLLVAYRARSASDFTLI